MVKFCIQMAHYLSFALWSSTYKWYSLICMVKFYIQMILSHLHSAVLHTNDTLSLICTVKYKWYSLICMVKFYIQMKYSLICIVKLYIQMILSHLHSEVLHTNESLYKWRNSIHSYWSIIPGKVLPWPAAGSTYMYEKTMTLSHLHRLETTPFFTRGKPKGREKGNVGMYGGWSVPKPPALFV